MSTKPMFHAGTPEPQVVYAFAEDIARKDAEIERLRADNVKLRAALQDAACYIGECDMEFVQAMWRKAGVNQQKAQVCVHGLADADLCDICKSRR